MEYKIQITKVEPNQNYKEQLAQYSEEMSASKIFNRRYDEPQPIEPQKEFVKDVLITVLTEEQFKKVKSEVLKVFE